ncbi:MAG: DUF4197 domain-containing protein [Bacteroidales bacterium]|nr:DUF4197 domain-containing protein [Bacteroidales bacterium]
MKFSQFVWMGVLSSLLMTACEEDTGILFPSSLTETEVVHGLKDALRVGTDTAVKQVSAVDGFYGDNLIRILLPPEADVITEHLNDPLVVAAGVDTLFEKVILLMNRAAEDAAVKAGPIFLNAVTTITFGDAFDILNGSDTAATHYLREKTWTDLKNAFQPDIEASLDKPLVGGVSTNEAWSSLTGAYNIIAMLTGWQQVNTDLDDHVTRKALNGLFLKISQEETAIRTDPLARVTEILRRVFG